MSGTNCGTGSRWPRRSRFRSVAEIRPNHSSTFSGDPLGCRVAYASISPGSWLRSRHSQCRKLQDVITED